MPLFRKKLVVIEARQLNEQTYQDINNWSNGAVYSSPIVEPSEDNPSGVYWQVNTKKGVMVASLNDFIIKGVEGEFYACDPNIFAKTYEAAANSDMLLISEYAAKEIQDSLRMVIRTFECDSEKTCLDRTTVKAKFYIDSVLDKKPNESYYDAMKKKQQ